MTSNALFLLIFFLSFSYSFGKVNFTIKNQYIQSKSCQECHTKEYQEWSTSHHQKAMGKMTSQTVLADFNQTQFKSGNTEYIFYKKEEEFWFKVTHPSKLLDSFQLIYTFGFSPLQQYLFLVEKGRYQVLTVAWDIHKKKWFDLYPNQEIPEGDWFHWKEGGQSWNQACAECHSTNVIKNYLPKTESYQTSYEEITVGCEACHGPGSTHQNWISKNEQKSYWKPTKKDEYTPKGFLNTFDILDKEKEIENCARCHSRRTRITNKPWSGIFLNHYKLALINYPQYHFDGQVNEEDYVYGSFLQSKMYQQGVTCTDCHNPHSNKLKLKGNSLCTQCHSPQNKKYNFTKNYDTPKHHKHPINSTGSQCINCHMPGKFFMTIDFRRDHSFTIPDPKLSEKIGSPDVCTECHQNKNQKWVFGKIKHWYPKEDTIKKQKEAEILLVFNQNPYDTINNEKVIAVLQNSKTSDVIKASILSQFSIPNLPKILQQMIIHSLSNQSPLIRFASLSSYLALSSAYQKSSTPKLIRLLTDSIRSIRVEAAQRITPAMQSLFSKEQTADFKKAKKEMIEFFQEIQDVPSGLNTYGLYFQVQNKSKQAKERFLKALNVDSLYDQARLNLAYLYSNQGNLDSSIYHLKRVIQHTPQYEPAYYSLGLIYAQQQQWDSTIVYLKQSFSLNFNLNALYNLSLAYQNAKDVLNAKKYFLLGLKYEPESIRFLHATTILYAQLKEWKNAKVLGERLLKTDPLNKDYRNLLSYIASQYFKKYPDKQ